MLKYLTNRDPVLAWEYDALCEIAKSVGQEPLSKEEAIRISGNWLISRLYKPHAFVGSVVISKKDMQALGFGEFVGMLKEPVNWGSLYIADVEMYREENHFLVTVVEAMADQCPNLCAFLEHWLHAWGWIVTVQTEW